MPEIEVIARAVIIDDNKLLLCQAAGKSHYYLPGGHVEFGETAEVALARELQEELGTLPVSTTYIGCVEHIYTGSDRTHHEINLVFKVELGTESAVSQEDHIEFTWQPLDQLSDVEVFPTHLTAAVQQWVRDQQLFWRPAITDAR